MNKKSRVASILNLIFSLGGFAFWGYMAYVISAFGQLAYQSADTNVEKIEIIMLIFTVSLPAFMCLVNVVMSCISFKYLGRGADRYKNGFMIAMFTVEIVALASFVVYIAMSLAGETLMLGLAIAFIVLYALCAGLHICDYAKAKKAALASNDQPETNDAQ